MSEKHEDKKIRTERGVLKLLADVLGIVLVHRQLEFCGAAR